MNKTQGGKMLTEKNIDMKNNKIINLWIVSLMLIIAACQPIEDRDILENTTDVEGVQLVATQSTPGDCCPPVDAAGKMVFDLDSGANYSYYADANGDAVMGSFVLDVKNQTLQVKGANILGAEQGNPDGLYTIISLTEDELILYVPNNAGGTGWTWVFKPE